MNIKKRVLYFAGLARFLKKCNPFVQSGKCSVSFGQKIKMMLQGFYPDEAVLYDFQTYQRKDFLTDYAMCCRAVQINCGYTELLNNKLVFSSYMSRLAHVPKVYAYIQNGTLYDLASATTIGQAVQQPELYLKELLTDTALIAKVFDAGSGEGIYKLSIENGEICKNNVPLSSEQLQQLLNCSHQYHLCAFVGQAAYSRNIFSQTCNTVKLLTFIDPQTGIPFLVRAFHRFGTKKSFPVDNLGHGSCLSNIDIRTGIMGPTYILSDGKMRWIQVHPDTQVPIDGVAVTGFTEVCNSILQCHASINYIPYIAWDVVIQDNGYILLEGNANTDMAGIQPFEPLLLNERAKDFYRYHGVVS